MPGSKRALDVTCCLIALPFFLLCTVMVAVAGRVVSPGPIFFLQERVGQRGRRFKLYKFRTMHVCADTGQHEEHFARLARSKQPMQKLDQQGDSRLIPGARWLRASGLDELPQIINVLRGEMSFVGPRPCLPYEYAHYSAAQRRRFSVMPGLTGLWQVSGKNLTTFDEMIRLDVRYAESRSLKLDLQIILRTPGAILAQMKHARAARNGRVDFGEHAL